MQAELEEMEAKPVAQRKTRKCLMCNAKFDSAWAGERICKKCKSTEAWRRG